MNKYVKMIVTAAVIAGYYILLRHIAPPREPYFVLGIAVIGYVAWLFGVTAGIATALLLTPLTFYVYGQFELTISFDAIAKSPAYIALQVFSAASLGSLRSRIQQLQHKRESLMDANDSLQTTLSNVREMGGIHSFCTSCKSIQNDDGTWSKIDVYLKEKTKVEFSHGLCPECAGKYENPPGEPD